MSLTLWSSHGNSRATKILIAAEIANVPLEFKYIGYENLKTKEFLAVNPFGRIPTLETPEGPIFESFAILRYIARKSNSLYGKDAWEQAQIDTWLNMSLSELDPIVISYFCAATSRIPLTKDRFNQVTKAIKDWAKSFDQHLKNRTYIVGDSLSVADISVASYFYWLLRLLFDEKSRSQLANVLKWYERISVLPQFVNALGKTWYAEKEFVPTVFEEQANKKPVNAEKGEQKPKQDKPKQQKQAKQEKPKDEKPKEEKKKDKKKEEEDNGDDFPVEKKAANPLDSLPKSSFILDDFKREISNNPDKNESLKIFWEKYDPQGWSLWKCDYDKYQGQGVVGYLTSNLKNGYVRNLDHFRKYCFGVIGVYGAEGCFDIRGVMLWRGTQMAAEIKQHVSGQYYKYRKLDHTKEQDRKLVEEYWTNTNEGVVVEGMPCFEVKHFK